MPRATPPSNWATTTWAAITLSTLLSVTAATLALVITFNASTATTASMHLAAGLLTLATIGVALAWRRTTRVTVDLFGGHARRYLSSWGTRLWSMLLFSGYAVQYLGGADNKRALVAGAILRALAALALLAEVLTTRTRVHRLVAGLVEAPNRYEPNSPDDGMLPQLVAWNATQWDPELQAEIEHRRRHGTGQPRP
ncbi:hypothetical protein ACTOB_004022 [Actinoplanes oblitus]|uniref:MFS transporter n=1 Tax=Actinoplanes oblitus TaxID=3040509 RepID=A0ABY8WS85_9ACTN|nr:hypothetical protein [Actinoplanes oblitus]WIN00323.1 hypothetical protein ACTOB_004022 [Actinoplanes oblitus]